MYQTTLCHTPEDTNLRIFKVGVIGKGKVIPVTSREGQ
jgi:hypothetical protein